MSETEVFKPWEWLRDATRYLWMVRKARMALLAVVKQDGETHIVAAGSVQDFMAVAQCMMVKAQQEVPPDAAIQLGIAIRITEMFVRTSKERPSG